MAIDDPTWQSVSGGNEWEGGCKGDGNIKATQPIARSNRIIDLKPSREFGMNPNHPRIMAKYVEMWASWVVRPEASPDINSLVNRTR
jgi:hypothetical protein